MLKESARDKSTEEEKKGSDPEDGCEGAARKKEPIRSCHREGNTARGSKGEREGLRESFLKRGGSFFCWGFSASPDLQQCTAQAESKVLCSHFSYHVVTFNQVHGGVCSNELPCASNVR